MKKMIIRLVVLSLALSLAGCGAKERAGEALAEKILEEAGVEADLDGDKVVIKGEDGQELTFGEGEWPTSDLAKNIPEFKGGKVASLMEAGDSLFIMIEEVTEQDFSDYWDEVKEAFTEETYEMSTDTGIMYAAENGKGVSVMLTYEKGAGFSITVAQAQPEED